MSQPGPPSAPQAPHAPQQAPTYGQPHQQPYGAPQSSAYGAPTYGQPPQQFPGQQPYGQPQQVQQPYGQPQQVQQPYPGQQPSGGSVRQCRFCGCVPAVDATFRGHQGMIIVMRFLSLQGPFCRDCGLSTFRSMTARTLVQGWYGYASFVITPVTVLINLIRRGKVAKLPQPQPSPYGQSRPPMDPGAPLLARPTAVVGLFIPVFLVLLIVALVILDN